MSAPISQAVEWLASEANPNEDLRRRARSVLDALLFHELSQPHGGARRTTETAVAQQPDAVCTPRHGERVTGE